MQPTKTEFLTAYKRALIIEYRWTDDAGIFKTFMEKVEKTLNSVSMKTSFGWNYSGKVVYGVWRGLGQKGRPTLTQLRALK